MLYVLLQIYAGGGVNLYGKATTIFLTLASLSYITSEHLLMWDVGWQFCFLSYFMMGYKLRQWGKSRKNNKIAILLISAGFTVNAILAYINFLRGLKGQPIDVIQYYKNPISYMPLAPAEAIASCLIFAGFSVLDIKKDYSKLAGYTFLIYLVHSGIWNNIFSAFLGDRLIENQIVEAISVVILSEIVFLISYFVAMIYKSWKIESRLINAITSAAHK